MSEGIHIIPVLAGVLLAVGLIFAGFSAGPSPAECREGCLPTFCGHDSECPGRCSCWVEIGSATGRCG